MSLGARDLQEHLASGTTTLCRCWRIVRSDGCQFAFTDHDEPVAFADARFVPTEAPTASAVEQTTGLAVDNSEALGALTHSGLREEDILAGRFDAAKVEIWLVNWSDPEQRRLQFRGEIGEIERSGGSFRAELRGLTEELNQPQGRLYQRQCRAVLGDRECSVDLGAAAYSEEVSLIAPPAGTLLMLPDLAKPAGWFARGTVEVLDGGAAGDRRLVKADQKTADGRQLSLWDALPGEVGSGTRVRVTAGCNKSTAMCHAKFDNLVNYRGFPFLPSEDWLYAYPKGGENS